MIKQHKPAGIVPVTIIIPAHNEQDGIEAVIAGIRENFIVPCGRGDANTEIIVVDDGSTDLTAGRARQTGATVIHHPGNLGYGAAIKTALRAAAHETIILTDGDGTYPARHMESLLRALETCDMAVGMRTGSRAHIPAARRPAKWLLQKFAVCLAEKPIPDINSGLRAFLKSDAMRFIGLYPSGFSFTTTITLAFLSSDLLVDYIPIDYHPRVGRSKIRPLRDTRNLFLTVLRCTLFFNPLRVCIPIALVLFTIAFFMLLFVRDSHGNMLDGAMSVLLISAVQTLFIGFMADIMSRMR
ncbi:MAG: glycosyltransferase family 2 protein [bacterium]|nr:glycosyltransferase family 2 protein [Candidatus Sumerlaeota bacterium]